MRLDLLPSRNSAKLSSFEVKEVVRREKAKEIKKIVDDVRLKILEQYDVLKLIGSSSKTLDADSVISLAQQSGLHISPRTVQNYLIELERLNLVKLQRIRKDQGHSQLIKPLLSLKELK